jgi:predicted SAM-dependent methyltransferase
MSELKRFSRQLINSLGAPARLVTWERKLRRRNAKRDEIIAAYLAKPGVKKLQIGTGNNILPGWLNTDLYTDVAFNDIAFLDVSDPFPFKDNTFDVVFSEHMIEHVPYALGQTMLKEIRRVLKPGGKVRIATPNLANILALYTDKPTPAQERYIKWSVDRHDKGVKIYSPQHVINTFMNSWGHSFVYDPKSMREAFTSAGFVDITEHRPEQSDVPELKGIETHAKELGSVEMNELETMVFEGAKPR